MWSSATITVTGYSPRRQRSRITLERSLLVLLMIPAPYDGERRAEYLRDLVVSREGHLWCFDF
jgi:hypothetical protein